MNDLIEKLRAVEWEETDDCGRMPDDPTHKCVFVDMRPDDFRALLREDADTALSGGPDNDRANVAVATATLQAEIEALRAEVERLSRYYKNGIDCFANPCERHSGERTPPFAEFFEKYGGQCLICVVDNNKALQAENERLAEALELMVTTHDEGGWPTATIAIARAALTAYRKQGGEQ